MFLLEKSILVTVVYYDVLQLPLTAFEIHKYLINFKNSVSFFNVLDALEESSILQKFIDHKNGFYFLKGRGSIVQQRIKKEKIIQEKWKKCKLAIKMLGMVPFLRLVVLSGSMAVGNASKASDIDLLIVTKKRRIWTARLMVTILLSLLGKRRHGEFIKDRICLNHYVTDASLKINFPSLYNAQTYTHLIPVLGERGLFESFKKENSWIKNWIQQEDDKGENFKYLKPNLFLKIIARAGELILRGKWGDFVEKVLRKGQRRTICRNEIGVSGQFRPRGRITIDDTQLEFHPDSPEAWIIEGYNKKMKELGFPELAKERDSGLTPLTRFE